MVKKIDRESLKTKMDNGEVLHLIEVLMPKEYERLHIKGAENIPLSRVGSEAVARFDRDETIVVYCADARCKASPKAAEKLEVFGFTDLYDYEGGKQDWLDAGYPMEGREA
jgi:rhodanese-related sulfurtransferase